MKRGDVTRIRSRKMQEPVLGPCRQAAALSTPPGRTLHDWSRPQGLLRPHGRTPEFLRVLKPSLVQILSLPKFVKPDAAKIGVFEPSHTPSLADWSKHPDILICSRCSTPQPQGPSPNCQASKHMLHVKLRHGHHVPDQSVSLWRQLNAGTRSLLGMELSGTSRDAG